MTKTGIDSPQFLALNREASLAVHMVCSGATTLRRADAATTGLYAQAFFDLSIGLERMAKLIFILDFCYQNNGRFPKDADLRKHGHDLAGLVVLTKTIRQRYKETDEFRKYPADEIVSEVVACLSEFAKATRYYNLDYLVGGKSVNARDPIGLWFERVGSAVLERHYKLSQRRKDSAVAAELGSVLDRASHIRFTAEDGSPISDAKSMFAHSARTAVVQKWGQFYAIQLVRYLAVLLMDLSHEAYKRRFDFVPDMSDHFRVFYNHDSYIKTRKTWAPV
ncbi:MAG TPA: hypothetical protein VNH44_09250 [Micropepsaceae bacterium]|nr:hypothetical protein [Micropepsaceae bacterium]